MSANWQIIEGGITAAMGYKACGVAAGIKHPGAERRDVALVVSDVVASVAGVFTTNRVQAAPVKLDREKVTLGHARAILVNSGNANACTGAIGMQNAKKMCQAAAEAIGGSEEDVLVCSTGVIGVQLPMDRVEIGIRKAAAELSSDGGDDASLAIMTTDTVPKSVAKAIEIEGKRVVIGGMAKGSGMIEPNMATMLGFLTTDVQVDPHDLQALLKRAADESFNRITIDGDQSTNDTLLMMANGASGVRIGRDHASWETFERTVCDCCRSLARMMVADGEGATKFVTVHVSGARSDSDAQRAAKAIAHSSLFKTACFGEDPNWGRVMAAAGDSGAEVDETQVVIQFDAERAYCRGEVADPDTLKRLEAVMKKKEFEVTVDLGIGEGAATVLTCDCSLDYVRINSEYTT